MDSMKAICTIILLVLTFHSFGQNQPIEVKRSNNMVYLGGNPYYIHIVRNGESLYAISKAYEMPIDTILKDNLHLTKEIKPNQYIKIRVIGTEVKTENAKTTTEYQYHTVVKGDTPYNLALKYNISIDELYELNPNAKLSLRIGDSIKIPVKKNMNAPLASAASNISNAPSDSCFIIHKVEKKQTLMEIALIYKTTEKAIVSTNIVLKDHPIENDQLLKIKVSQNFDTNNPNYFYHRTLKSETIYGILKNNQIKEKELYKLNPSLSGRPLQVDELIKLPKNNPKDAITTNNIEIKPNPKEELKRDQFSHYKDTLIYAPCPNADIDKNTIYKVAFFLPLYLNVNDTLGKYLDIISKDDKGNESITTIARTGTIEDKIYSRTKIFLEFYQGALLALYDLKKMGINLDVSFIDTRNDSAYLVEIFKKEKLSDYNLFIGPVTNDMLSIAGEFAKKHHINIVSPLSVKSDFIENNPYAFQVTPPFEVQVQYSSDFLHEMDSKNYIVIHDGNNADQEYISNFKTQLYAQLNKDNLNQVKYNEVYYYDAQDSVLKVVFTPGIKNIVIVPSENQAFVTDVMGKLNGYSYEYDITLLGQPRWLRFENIELEQFYNTNTHIFSNSFIDYKKTSVQEFVEKYRNYYKGEPDKFAFQGYDITKFFCISMNKYGKDFRLCQHNVNIDLLQTKLHFQPISNHGGYQNTAIYLLEFTKDFKLNKTATYPVE